VLSAIPVATRTRFAVRNHGVELSGLVAIMLLREKQFARDPDHFWSKQNETFDVKKSGHRARTSSGRLK
jgi:hypothetical protein